MFKSILADRPRQRTTLGFMQVGRTNISSANCKSKLQFGQTNIYQL